MQQAQPNQHPPKVCKLYPQEPNFRRTAQYLGAIYHPAAFLYEVTVFNQHHLT